MTKTMTIKPAGMSFFVVIYAIILALIGTYLGITSLLDPTSAVNYTEGAEPLASAWAGRTLGLGLAAGLAVYFRSARVYTVAFLGSVCREFGDIVGMISTGQTVTIAVLSVFLVLDIIGLIYSVRAIPIEQSQRD